MTPEVGPLIVGYDGRDESERALTLGISEARERGVAVVVLVVGSIPYEVVDPYDAGGLGMAVLPPIPPEGPLEIQPILNEARRQLDESGVDGTVDWSLGDPASEILRVAEERQASAIVVGTHHHSALGRFLGTDTAAELIRDAHCDVIVAH